MLSGQIGKLQRHGREGDEPVGRLRAGLCQSLVLDLDDFCRAITLRYPVPVRVDTQRLDVDPLGVHGGETHVDGRRHVEIGAQTGASQFLAHQGQRLGDGAVRMNIDRPDAAAVDDDFAASTCRVRGRPSPATARNEYETAR